jgi:hypothetical protein
MSRPAGVGNEPVVLGRGTGDADRVARPEGVVADEVGRNSASEADDGNAVHQGIDETGDHVGRPRPRGDEDDSDLAGGARVAPGGMDRGLLVAHEDVADAVLPRQRIVDRQDSPARITEDDLDALVGKRAGRLRRRS